MAGIYRKREQYRSEWKYYISLWEAELLKQRLLPFMELDPYAVEGKYTIRSLYFDDYWNSSYEEKIMGVDNRKKWRIRIYGFQDTGIKLERKKKWNSYIYKKSASLTREEYDSLMAGEYDFLLHHEEPLCREFYYECTVNLQRPKVIVDYEREPLIRPEGDVRITFDADVRTAVSSFDIFDPDLPTLAVLDEGMIVLEVKFTQLLPEMIKELLPAAGQEFSAISKYTLCYEKAHHLTDVMAGISKTNNWGRKFGSQLPNLP